MDPNSWEVDPNSFKGPGGVDQVDPDFWEVDPNSFEGPFGVFQEGRPGGP